MDHKWGGSCLGKFLKLRNFSAPSVWGPISCFKKKKMLLANFIHHKCNDPLQKKKISIMIPRNYKKQHPG